MFCATTLIRRRPQTFTRAMSDDPSTKWRSTTILCVRKDNKVVIVGDGQVSNGYTVCKGNAIKVRKLAGDVIVGMAGTSVSIIAHLSGSAGDCLTLIDHLEGLLGEASGNLTMACVNLVKAWRTEKILRRLNAQLVVADKTKTLLVSGTGDVVEPEDGLVAIGSGGLYALSAAKALVDIEGIDAEEIARKSMLVYSISPIHIPQENCRRFVCVHKP